MPLLQIKRYNKLKLMKTVTIIPSRLSASRLPGKPLLKINGLSIISHVFERAQEANIGEVIVATEDQEIVEDVTKNGGKAILTSKNHKTGSDRIYEALNKINVNDIDLVMNLQGDEPIIDINDIINLNKKMIENNAKIGTLASDISNLEDLNNENMVKVVTQKKLNEDQFLEAETFLRTSKIRDNIYHRIGIQSYLQLKLHNNDEDFISIIHH